MKRINKIEINHFKGLYGEHEIDLTNSGKILMLYGVGKPFHLVPRIAIQEIF